MSDNIKIIYDKIVHKFESSGVSHMRWHCFLPIKSIDSIDVEIEIHLCNRCDGNLHMNFKIYEIWKHKELYREEVTSYEDLENFLHKVLPSLRFHYAFDILTPDLKAENPMYLHIGYELYKEMSKCENITTTLNECSVCFEVCKTNTSCGHPLCRKCETKLKDTSCPICRTNYNHYMRNTECDSDED